MLANIAESQRTLQAVSRDFNDIIATSQDKISKAKRYYDEELKESAEMLEENKSSSIKQKVKKCEEDLIDLELQIEIQEKRLEQLKEESV